MFDISGEIGLTLKCYVKIRQATFERRTTALPSQTPFGLSEAFAADPAKQAQWFASLRRTEIAMAPEPLSELISTISKGMNLKIVLGQINANPDKLLHGRFPLCGAPATTPWHYDAVEERPSTS